MMNFDYLGVLNDKEMEIIIIIFEIIKGIEDLKLFLEFNDFSLFFVYKFINDEFRRLF